MIRAFSDTDMDRVLDVWLASSIEAHGFVEAGFLAARAHAIRHIFIPASETYVYESNGQVTGFFSLHEDTLAAIFVAPDCQGEGIGRRMMEKAKTLRARLSLEVYKENRRSVAFYRSCGFDEVEEKEDPHTGHRALVMVFGAVHGGELPSAEPERQVGQFRSGAHPLAEDPHPCSSAISSSRSTNN